ncbi:16S rRNA (cytidine(1402)-2'-O)-methyltransferase [Falsibacillus pallidus]|uniref:Ribosomal RNA small subunit methyltransferase I n=1 Tax=Falsibacillus pallidus TaxID=493781 RepID=A0A370G794_9BACI|nr:16S rRNA (cytidine(1402)-2'-O)-methyltransferase [Falsibacillus pallidus]RDI38394.1 16S rRNA (cytidine1402-2'-O)-methyltransferase [Falsibacillus pallidus]
MQIQKSFDQEESKGMLYLVPTPIGNLEDMTYRALRILKEADLIAAEDTRNTKKLCNYFEITTPLVSYHEHNKETSGKQLIQSLKDGKKIALVSDAGMPAISDPGYEVVAEALQHDITVVPLPGANAALSALIASGIATQPFYFYGFLQRNKKDKKEELEQLKYQSATMILYESPHRLKETLQLIHQVWGDRRMAVCRELTKRFEEFIRGTVSELLEWTQNGEVRGEFCLIIEGSVEEQEEKAAWWEDLSIMEHVDHYVEQGNKPKDAIKLAAVDRDMPKREVYAAYHIE